MSIFKLFAGPDIDKMKQKRDITGLTKLSIGTNDWGQRKKAIDALVELNDPIGLQNLLPILNESDSEIRQMVIKLLAELKDPEVFNPLFKKLDSINEEERKSVADLFGEIQNVHTAEKLLKKITDLDNQIDVWIFNIVDDSKELAEIYLSMERGAVNEVINNFISKGNNISRERSAFKMTYAAKIAVINKNKELRNKILDSLKVIASKLVDQNTEEWRQCGILHNKLESRYFISSQSLKEIEQYNLYRWKNSNWPLDWIKKHNFSWNHNDWNQLIEELKLSSYWPISTNEVNAILNEIKKNKNQCS
jgi:hypothetical protein